MDSTEAPERGAPSAPGQPPAPGEARAGRTLLLVDGSALLYRSHFAFLRNPLKNSRGEVTSATFGMLQALLPLIDKRKPDRMAVVFDTVAPTFRHRVYAEYKAHRPPMPDDLACQIPRVREAIRYLGIAIVEQEGVEADDLIGSLACEAARDSATTLILTSDKDFYQLVNDRIVLLSPKGRGAELTAVDRAGVRERYGVEPGQMVDLLALMGDASDNVPGVPGIGEKTAAQLIQKFQSVDAIYAALDQVERPSIREKLRQNEDRARLSYKLATIRSDLPLERHWHELVRAPVEYVPLLALLEDLDLRVLARRYREEYATRGGAPLGPAPAREAPEPSAPESAPAAGATAPAAGGTAAAPGTLPGSGPPVDAAPAPPAKRRGGRNPAVPAAAVGQPVGTIFDVLVEGESPMRDAPSGRAPLGRYHVLEHGDDLESLARELADARGPVAFDTETTGFDPLRSHPVGIALATAEGRAFYLPLGHASGRNLDPDRAREALTAFFRREDAVRVAQNAKYDWHVLERFGVPVRDIAFDTMIAAFLVDPDQPKSLDHLAKARLGIAKIPTEALLGRGKEQVTMASVSVDRVAEYCCEDADVTLRLVPLLHRELESLELLPLFRDVEMPLVGVLTRMERTGVRIDTAALDALGRGLQSRLDDLAHNIEESAGVPFNVNSPRQVAEVLFERLGLPKGKRTRDGFSTDTEVLERLALLHPLPKLLLDWRQASKLKSAYVDSLPRLVHPETGRVHATFHQTIASTGRLSVSDPSLQNIPIRTEEGREIRRAFVAQEARGLLVSFDYSQIELRILAHLTHDPALTEAFRTGGDVHASTASRLFGVSPDLVTPAQRAQAKVVNFGIMYGMGPQRLARELSLSRSLAQAFIDEYKRTHAGVATFMESTLAQARERGYVETILKRRRPLPNLCDPHDALRSEAERAAINAPIQGSAADLIKIAMVRIDALLAEKGLRSRLILQVHDELLFETDEEEIEVLTPLVQEIMEDALPLRVPLVVHRGVGTSWADAHA
jgi:DNA polymerase I